MKISAFLLTLMIATPVYAHDWYDGACCNKQDCRQTLKGEVTKQMNGWLVVKTNEVILFHGDDRLKASKDPLMHICSYQYKQYPDKEKGDTRCLYVAATGG